MLVLEAAYFLAEARATWDIFTFIPMDFFHPMGNNEGIYAQNLASTLLYKAENSIS